MHYHMFTRASGFRKGVPKIAIVITDGMSNIGLNTKVEADAAKKDNITLFAIGIGGAVNQRELKDIASNPNFVFSTNNFKNLNKIVDGLVKTTCKGKHILFYLEQLITFFPGKTNEQNISLK